MPAYVLIVDLFGALLAVIGFMMVFQQSAVRRFIGRPQQPSAAHTDKSGDEDPLTYALRIAGAMIMVFGIAIGGMVTLFYVVSG